jgi:hypothetical protein
MINRLVLLIAIFILLAIEFGCNSIDNRFEQVGYYKRQLPNGSYHRVFLFYVKNFSDDAATWKQIEICGKEQMFTKGGSTSVFFFNNRNYTPDVTFIAEQFGPMYEAYCIAAYWKYPSGVDKFSKHPFK